MSAFIAYDNKTGKIIRAFSWSGTAETERAIRSLIAPGLSVMDVNADHPAMRDISNWKVINEKLIEVGKHGESAQDQ